MQHARLRMAEIQPLARARDGHIGQAALFLQTTSVHHGVLVREQAFFHAAYEYGVELQPLARMHRHQLHGVLTCLGLVVAGLQRGMGEKGSQRRHGFTRVCIDHGCQRACRCLQRLIEQRASGSSPWLTGLCVRFVAGRISCASTGRATASLPKPSWVTKLSAAVTSSCKFSMRSAPSFHCGNARSARFALPRSR